MRNPMRKFRQRAGRCLLAITIAAGTAVFAAPQAQAAWGDNYTLTPRHTLNYPALMFTRPHCLDVGWYSMDQGAPVVSAQCGGTLNQFWTMTWSVNSNDLKLSANHGSKCLDVERT